MIQLFQQTAVKEAHAFLPDEAEHLIHESMQDVIGVEGQNEGFLKALVACAKSSREKRFGRASIIGFVRGVKVRNLITK